MTEDKEKLDAEGDIPAEYEASFLNLWTVILTGAGILVIIVLVLILAGALYGVFGLRGAPVDPFAPVVDADLIHPEVQRRIDAPEEMLALRATQTARLESYQWINQEAGIVRIPIQSAMEIVAARGLPDFPDRISDIPPETELTPGIPDEQALIEAGARAFDEFGCGGCHQEQDTPVAPTVIGIYGQPRPLDTGETVIADEIYLRNSILNPEMHVVAGYQDIMPSYRGRVTEEQLEALIAYIASLGNGE
jgi:mono/diheme cytochrome c family protein